MDQACVAARSTYPQGILPELSFAQNRVGLGRAIFDIIVNPHENQDPQRLSFYCRKPDVRCIVIDFDGL